MPDVLTIVNSLATEEFVRTTARQLGAGEDVVARALSATASVLLHCLADHTGDAAFMSRVATLIEQPRDAFQSAASHIDATGYVPPPVPTPGMPSTATRLGRGTALLNMVLGARLQALVEALAGFSGLPATSARAVIGHAAPLVLRGLGLRLDDPSTAVPLAPSAARLAELMVSERTTFERAAPAAVLAAVGDHAARSVPASDAGVTSQTASTAAGGNARAASRTTAAADGSIAASEVEGTSFDLRTLAGVLAALALLWWLFLPGLYATFALRVDPAFLPPDAGARIGNRPVAAETPTGAGPGTTAGGTFSTPSSVTPSSSSPAGAMSGIFRVIKRTLPTKKQIDYAEEGIEARMMALIEDRSRPLERTQWFDFDRLNFQTGSSNLTPESRAQAQNIADILEAYPSVKIKIGGYTDNVGDPQANQRLSEARAQRVMTELITLGVNALRLEAEGYGDQHPIGDNATSEGRARNRRIAVRVTER